MFYVSVNYIRFGFKVETREEAEERFEEACKKYPFSYIVIYDENGKAVKERKG